MCFLQWKMFFTEYNMKFCVISFFFSTRNTKYWLCEEYLNPTKHLKADGSWQKINTFHHSDQHFVTAPFDPLHLFVPLFGKGDCKPSGAGTTVVWLWVFTVLIGWDSGPKLGTEVL